MEPQNKLSDNPISYYVRESLEIAKKKSDIAFWHEVRREATRKLQELGES